MFDKITFKNLLEKARGNRSNEDYSRDSGVSRAYISNFLNLKRAIPPTPDILKKLADAAYDNVTYRDFMDVAGYLNSDEVSKEITELSLKLENLHQAIAQKHRILDRIHKYANIPIADERSDEEETPSRESIEFIEVQIAALENEVMEIISQLDLYKNIQQESINLSQSLDLDEDIQLIARGMQKLKEENPEDFDTVKRVLRSMSKKADEELKK